MRYFLKTDPTASTNNSEWSLDLLSHRAANLPAAFNMSGAPGVISFSYGLPDEASFPAAELAQATAEVMRDAPGPALQYGAPDPLLSYLVDFIGRDQGLELTTKNLLVTVGSSQALGLVCQLLVDPGDYVVVEAPTFLGAVRTFLNAEAEVVEVPLDNEGILIEELDQTITDLKAAGKRVKFIYTIPTFQNPTGVTLGLERRKALLAVAKKHQVLVLEDDAYAGLIFEGEVPPWLWTLDQDNLVLHCGTFSKILAAGLRLGWIGGPPELISKIAALKVDGGTSPFAGNIAAQYARDGRLEKHILKLREIYRRKRDRTLAGLERYMPDGARWTSPQGGFFIWLELPERLDTVKMLRDAITAGVNYTPGPACFASRKGKNTIRLAFSHLPVEQIEPGLRILGEVIQRNLTAGA
jgi:2-aminoadipate transaminase